LAILAVLNFYFLIHYSSILKKLNKDPFYSFFKNNKIDWISVALLSLGTVLFSYVMFFSGLITSEGLSYVGVNTGDGVRHVSYIKNQLIFFPPQNPTLAGVELKSFHYFYDFMLSRFSLFFGFLPSDLYFRLFPPLISLLFGLSFYLISRKLSPSKIVHRFVLFFAFSSQSFTVIGHFLNPAIDISYSAVPQAMGLIINPFTVLGIALMVTSLYLLPKIKDSVRYALLFGLIAGVISQVKVYCGIIVIAALLFYSFYLLLKFKQKFIVNIFVAVITSGILTAVTFLPNNAGEGGLILAPFWFYRNFMTHSYFESLQWEIKWWISYEAGDTLKLYFLYIQAFIFFWIFNLGLLSAFLFKAKKILTKDFWDKDYNFILFIAVIIPLILVTFFLQTPTVYEIVQFSWMIIPILSLPAGIFYAGLISKNKGVKTLIVVTLIIFTLPGVFDMINKYLPSKKVIIADAKNVAFYQNIHDAVPEKSFIIYMPLEVYIDEEKALPFYKGRAPVVSSVTGRSLYLEPGSLPVKLAEVQEQRLRILVELDKQLLDCRIPDVLGIIDTIGSKFLLSEKGYPCLATSSAVLKTSNSGSYHFYSFK
jgi:hypothetical protein